MEKEEKRIRFIEEDVEIEFEDESLANIWERNIYFWSERLFNEWLISFTFFKINLQHYLKVLIYDFISYLEFGKSTLVYVENKKFTSFLCSNNQYPP